MNNIKCFLGGIFLVIKGTCPFPSRWARGWTYGMGNIDDSELGSVEVPDATNEHFDSAKSAVLVGKE